MKDALLDIVKHTASLGFFECVKITGDDEKTVIQAADSLPTIILNGRLKEVEPDFAGEFGFNNLTYLKGIVNFEPFRRKGSSVSMVHKERNGETFPEIIKFTGDDGAEGSYRLMHESTLPQMPTFKGTEWQITFKPKKEKIDEFAQLAGLLSDMEQHFTAKTVNGNLVFFIGEEGSASHKAQIVMEKDVDGHLDPVRWPIQQVLQTLRLSQTGDVQVQISQKGVICVFIDSGLAEYNFLVIANQ